MDFQFDATADGRRLKFLNVIDEHSRLCMAIRVGRSCKAKDVVTVLEELTSLYPGLIQSVSQVLWPELPAWGLVGGIAPSLCPKPPLPQPILI